jgi:hypothetical protein
VADDSRRPNSAPALFLGAVAFLVALAMLGLFLLGPGWAATFAFDCLIDGECILPSRLRPATTSPSHGAMVYVFGLLMAGLAYCLASAAVSGICALVGLMGPAGTTRRPGFRLIARNSMIAACILLSALIWKAM